MYKNWREVPSTGRPRGTKHSKRGGDVVWDLEGLPSLAPIRDEDGNVS